MNRLEKLEFLRNLWARDIYFNQLPPQDRTSFDTIGIMEPDSVFIKQTEKDRKFTLLKLAFIYVKIAASKKNMDSVVAILFNEKYRPMKTIICRISDFTRWTSDPSLQVLMLLSLSPFKPKIYHFSKDLFIILQYPMKPTENAEYLSKYNVALSGLCAKYLGVSGRDYAKISILWRKNLSTLFTALYPNSNGFVNHFKFW